MSTYRVLGFSVESELPVKGVVEQSIETADVTFEIGSVGWQNRPENAQRVVQRDGKELFLFWKNIGSVRIRDKRHVTIDPAPEATSQEALNILFEPILGIVYHEMGGLTLHASAVCLDAGVVAFMGGKRLGKSTTASVLQARGHPLVADDCLAFKHPTVGSQLYVRPGIRRLKLWSDSLNATQSIDSERWSNIRQGVNKFTKAVADTNFPETLPLRGIYRLGFKNSDETVAASEPLTAREACLHAIQNTYALLLLNEHGITKSHFEQCGRLGRQVPVRWLWRTKSLDNIDDLASFIEDDVSRHF